VRDAHTDINTPLTSTVNQHYPKVDNQDLREAERSFHLGQYASERPRPTRRRQVYATSVHRILPQAVRGTTEHFKNQYRSSHSRSR